VHLAHVIRVSDGGAKFPFDLETFLFARTVLRFVWLAHYKFCNAIAQYKPFVLLHLL